MKIEKDDIDKKVDAIVYFANYQARDLESDIVSLVRNNLDNLNLSLIHISEPTRPY